MNSPSLTPEQTEALLRFAGKRLGISPAALAGTLQAGGTEALRERLSPQERQTLDTLLGDRTQADALLASPTVAALLKRLTEE